MIEKALSQPGMALTYHVSKTLAAQYRDASIVQFRDRFDMREFAAESGIRVELGRKDLSEIVLRAAGDDVMDEMHNGWYDVAWEGLLLRVLSLTIDESGSRANWIVSPSQEAARSLYVAMNRWRRARDGEIVAFERGHFRHDDALRDAVASSSFDDLILADDMAADLASDVANFFEARTHYERYGVAWRRGLLLAGPPGNGKSHALRALVDLARRPCIFVKSFDVAPDRVAHHGIAAVFAKARELAPAIVAIEDIDILVDDRNRSYFVNELDGFARNSGILILATTNHPERLDPSISERPGRFDRIYTFAKPDQVLRRRYIDWWNRKLEAELYLDPASIDALVAGSEGFSFAYLKELFVSSTMRWALQQTKPLPDVVTHEAAVLRSGMPSNSATAITGRV